jgi:hypothetical protein
MAHNLLRLLAPRLYNYTHEIPFQLQLPECLPGSQEDFMTLTLSSRLGKNLACGRRREKIKGFERSHGSCSRRCFWCLQMVLTLAVIPLGSH